MILIGKNTGNIELLKSIIEMLIHYLDVKKEKFTDEQLKDIVHICNKGLTHPERTINLFSKSLKIAGLIYNYATKISKMNIVKLINDTFGENKDDEDYLKNEVFILSITCLENKNYAEEAIDNKLAEKIMKKIGSFIAELKEPTANEDELMSNYTLFLKNLLDKKDEIRKKMCTEEIFENPLKIINLYSIQIILSKKVENNIVYTNPNDLQNMKSRLFNIIILNLLRFLTLLSVDDEGKDIITKNDFIKTILETISKPNVLPKVVIKSLLALKYYFSKDIKDKWVPNEIEELYNILKSLQKYFYANSDILKKILIIFVDLF